MADWDLLITNARVATMTGGRYGELDGSASVGIKDGVIDWIGSGRPAGTAATERSVAGRWLTPALIDCHTHLIFAGDRSAEFEQRLSGTSYEAIAESGGGILTTVTATRAATAQQLFDLALPRVNALLAEGVATVEIKSGYGLTIDDEIKTLEVARRLGDETPASVQATLLAAHTVPPEFAGNADGYIDLICDSLLPVVARRQLADAVDAYCETIAFDAAQIERLFRRCRELGLPVKLHADQLSDGGGASLAAQYGALSADHVEYTPAGAIAGMAAAGTAAVLLPGAYLTLGETQLPPIAAMRQHGIPVAVASDCNPGTSPICSLRTNMMLATRVFGLTPEETLAGTTCNAALALGLHDRGKLAEGLRADIAVWDISHPRELAYWLGTPQLAELIIGGHTTAT